MATANHGKRALLIADCTPTADGTLTVVPMLVDWSLDADRDFVDTTHTESENKEDVEGFDNYSLQLNFNDDLDGTAVETFFDGQRRFFYLYKNYRAAAGKRKYDYGYGRGSLSSSGGVSAKVGHSTRLRAAGAITHGRA